MFVIEFPVDSFVTRPCGPSASRFVVKSERRREEEWSIIPAFSTSDSSSSDGVRSGRVGSASTKNPKVADGLLSEAITNKVI
jgi:hypothetical protein